MKYLTGVAAALVLFADCAVARDRVELAPYSNWVMNYDDDSCALQRQFGEVGRQAFLELRAFGREQSLQVLIASKDFDRRESPFNFAFEPLDLEPEETFGFDWQGGDGYKGKLFSYQLGRDDARTKTAMREFAATAAFLTEDQRRFVVRSIDLDRESREYARLALNSELMPGLMLMRETFGRSAAWQGIRDTIESEAKGMLVEGAFDETLFLQTGALHAPMEAMRTCLDELQSHWGIDVDAHKTLTRPALPVDYDDLVRQIWRDYPIEMIRERLGAYLRVRLDISPEGDPTACHLQSQINDEAFERVACRNMMRHAMFAPALDKHGQAIASIYQTSIIYQLGS